ncbi:hypothetical protein [Vibrio diabolicus]|uniref:hypothetical protein n=2 Tax=Vibrio harveyi group TaxID=717610 RepID=UPI001A261A30|nr:hypothetical protein [Vibrio diabolicus]EGR5928266.1 hypothetical protein [Vibrio parahaemolyticus]MCS0311728.1 hypothetical protein [Vibrio diabolicus]
MKSIARSIFCVGIGIISFNSYALQKPLDIIDCESGLSNHKDFYGNLKERLDYCSNNKATTIVCAEGLRENKLFEGKADNAFHYCINNSPKNISKVQMLSRNNAVIRTYKASFNEVHSAVEKFDDKELVCAIKSAKDKSFKGLSFKQALEKCRSLLSK